MKITHDRKGKREEEGKRRGEESPLSNMYLLHSRNLESSPSSKADIDRNKQITTDLEKSRVAVKLKKAGKIIFTWLTAFPFLVGARLLTPHGLQSDQ